MLFARCGKRASSTERDHGHAEQPKEDPPTRSRWRPPLLLAGIRVRAAIESCNKPSIQASPRGANDLSSPHVMLNEF
jgi:hypothetical protein